MSEQNNDDVIVISESSKPNSEVPNEIVETNEVTKAQTIVQPYHQVPENYQRKDTTINIPNAFCEDTILAKYMDDEMTRKRKEKPGEEEVKDIVNKLEALQHILATSFSKLDFSGITQREGSEFVQKIVNSEGKNIIINSPIFAPAKNCAELVGDNAVRFINSVTKVGTVTRVPLFHSGIVLTLDVFKDTNLLDLHQRLIMQKMDLGTNSKGAIYTGDDVYVTATILEFILDHVIDCNLIDWNIKKLRSLILSNDIQSIICGALHSIYPRGYPAFHQCMNVVTGNCNYTVTAKRDDNGEYLPDTLLDFRRVIWVDNSRLNINHKLHMAVTMPTHTVDDIKRYQNEVNIMGDFAAGKSILKNSEVEAFVHFKIPTLDDFINNATEWCVRVSDMVDKIMEYDTARADERVEARNKKMSQYASIINIEKASHWISHISIVDSEGFDRKISEKNTLNNALTTLAKTDGVEETFFKNLQLYKEHSIFVVAGLPNYECPECHHGQTAPDAKYPSVIPMNMVSYFFILMVWRSRTKLEDQET